MQVKRPLGRGAALYSFAAVAGPQRYTDDLVDVDQPRRFLLALPLVVRDVPLRKEVIAIDRWAGHSFIHSFIRSVRRQRREVF